MEGRHRDQPHLSRLRRRHQQPQPAVGSLLVRPLSELTRHRCIGFDIHVPDHMTANSCTGAIWIEDFGYALDQRFADAEVIGVETTCAPDGFDPALRLNVLLPAFDDQYVGAEYGFDTTRKARHIADALEAGRIAGVIAATEAAMRDGVGGSLSSGLHHAKPERGDGFCTVNELVVAASAHLERHCDHRIVIVDVDAHCGGGVALQRVSKRPA